MRTEANRDGVGDTRYHDGNGTVRRGAVAELALVVRAPAQYGAIVQHRASVDLSSGDGDRVGDTRHRDGYQTIRHGAIAEIAVDVAAPAPNGAAVQERAGVLLTCGDGDSVGDIGYCYGHQTSRRGAIAERAIEIVMAPTLNGTAAQYRAGLAPGIGNRDGVRYT